MLPLEFTCPTSTSTCPATLLYKSELHCEDQNITHSDNSVQAMVSGSMLPKNVCSKMQFRALLGKIRGNKN